MFIERRAHYFSEKLNKEVVELYWQTALANFAVNLTYIFEPIFLYGLGFSITKILVFYLILYISYAVLVFPVTKITAKIGYKHAIFISSILYVCYWFFLYQIKFHPAIFFFVPIFFALEKSFFWPPYNADIAISNIKNQRGREIGVLFSLIELVSIIGPVAGGLLTYLFGFSSLFFVAAVFMVASVYPLFRSPEIYAQHSFRLKNFLVIFRHFPQNFFAYWGYSEDLMLMSLWPIYMFLLIPQVFSIGLIITVASCIGIMVMLYLGRVIDRDKHVKLLPSASVFYGLGWILRFFATSAPAVIAFDIQTRLGKAMVNIPLLAETYTIAGERGPDLAIAYAVFYEFSLSIGKILTALIAIWIISSGGAMSLVFIIVGVMTMFYGMLRK